MMPSDVCLSRTSGLSREQERPRETKTGTEVAHVTRDSDNTFKVKKSKVKVTRPLCSPPCWRVRRLQRWAWAWERDGRGKLLLRCRLFGGERRFGAHGGGEGGAYRGGRPPTACYHQFWRQNRNRHRNSVNLNSCSCDEETGGVAKSSVRDRN